MKKPSLTYRLARLLRRFVTAIDDRLGAVIYREHKRWQQSCPHKETISEIGPNGAWSSREIVTCRNCGLVIGIYPL